MGILFGLLCILPTGVLGAEEGAPAPTLAGYDNGFFVQDESGNNRLVIFGHLQFRSTYFQSEEGEDSFAFNVPRARLKFKGNLFDPQFTYGMHVAFDKGTSILKDYFVDYAIIPGDFRIRVGQHKRAYSRQYLLSGHYFQFIERGISHGFSGAGRDLGLTLHNGYPGDGFEWALGVYNGTHADAPSPVLKEGEFSGKYQNSPTQMDPIVTARMAWNYGGIKGYRMGDLEGGGFRFALGVNSQLNLDLDDEGDGYLGVGVDGIMKVHGLALDGAFYVNFDDSETGIKTFQNSGKAHYAALSYLIGDSFLPALRYHRVDRQEDLPGSSLSGSSETEYEGVFNYLLHGHRLKIQLDGAALVMDTGAGQTMEWRTRTQLNVVF